MEVIKQCLADGKLHLDGAGRGNTKCEDPEMGMRLVCFGNVTGAAGARSARWGPKAQTQFTAGPFCWPREEFLQSLRKAILE